jgi:hypothetical protein
MFGAPEMADSINRVAFLLIVLLYVAASEAGANDLPDRIAASDTVFTGRVLDVHSYSERASTTTNGNDLILVADVEILDFLVGDTSRTPKELQVVIRDSSRTVQEAKKYLVGRRLIFYGDLRLTVDEKGNRIAQVIYPPNGSMPEEGWAMPTVMQTIAECYGAVGPKSRVLPTRKCRLSR